MAESDAVKMPFCINFTFKKIYLTRMGWKYSLFKESLMTLTKAAV